ncbi:hypothetical protein BDW22DRAFT_1359419 [Trametopsis cervina]|nr:hypothetical protein BDW22DRAFT_1359419 [Trametopsis cervina]
MLDHSQCEHRYTLRLQKHESHLRSQAEKEDGKLCADRRIVWRWCIWKNVWDACRRWAAVSFKEGAARRICIAEGAGFVLLSRRSRGHFEVALVGPAGVGHAALLSDLVCSWWYNEERGPVRHRSQRADRRPRQTRMHFVSATHEHSGEDCAGTGRTGRRHF